MFDLVTQSRKDGTLTYADLVIAKVRLKFLSLYNYIYHSFSNFTFPCINPSIFGLIFLSGSV